MFIGLSERFTPLKSFVFIKKNFFEPKLTATQITTFYQKNTGSKCKIWRSSIGFYWENQEKCAVFKDFKPLLSAI